MSKLPSDATLDIINKLAGGGWNGTVKVSVDAEWPEGAARSYVSYAPAWAFPDPAPEQADPDTDMAALLDAFKNIRFDDFHDVDFSDAQKENLLVHVRGGFGGGWGGGR